MQFLQKMPFYVFYTMAQKSQKWPKTQIRGGGPALRWFGTVLGRTKCAIFFVKTYCLWHKQLEKEIILGGHRAPFFRKWVRTLLFLTFLRWLERPAQRSLRESQNGVSFPWKLRRIPIAWPRDRHVEEHWHRRRNQNLWNWKVWAFKVLTGRPWLPSLEGRFSVDISLCRYAMASTWKAETAS